MTSCADELKKYENNLKTPNKEENFQKNYFKAYENFQKLLTEDPWFKRSNLRILYDMGFTSIGDYTRSSWSESYKYKSKFFPKKDDYLKRTK
jgi:hypothetical protein